MRYGFAIIMICLCQLIAVAGSTAQSGGLLVKQSDSGGKRTAFIRMEKDARLAIDITNNTGRDLPKVTVLSKCDNDEIRKIDLLELQHQETRTFDIPVDTSVRPGRYVYSVSVAAEAADREAGTDYEIPVFIVKRKLPYQMPVVLWATVDYKLAKSLGFTHTFLFLPRLPDDRKKIWNAKSPLMSESSPELDKIYSDLNEALVEGFGIMAQIEPYRYINSLSPYRRIDRNGRNYTGHAAGNVCGYFKEIQEYYYNVGVSIAQTYGMYPSFDGANINTEIRDHANLCFHQHDIAAYKKASGKDIPDNVKNKNGLSYMAVEDFPANHILPDDDDVLDYLKWYWQEGDGWNGLTTLVHQGLKSTGRDDILTFTDPAVRLPSVSGSGGEVDAISHWSYCNPTPFKIGKTTDELFAMASLSKVPQKVCKMTQAIWYRSGAAPKDDGVAKVDWELAHPDCPYITIPPDCLREGFWSKISRGISGIMYHGVGAITEMPKTPWSYTYTNSKTKEVIKELVETIVEPLGPTLLQIPEGDSDVAFLESFASQMYAGVGEYGWGWGWESEAYQILRYAHLQPKVIYEEHIIQDALDDVKVLVLINCPILTESVVGKINDYQRKGGLIIADENVCFGVSPDILLQNQREGKLDPSAEKERLQKLARHLRQQLDHYYMRYMDSDNDDVLVRRRHYRDTDYVFTINDHRTFGDYVGHHNIVMEKGLPSAATVSLDRSQGYVYDLKTHKEVLPGQGRGVFEFPVELGPGGGCVFMVTRQKINSLDVAITGRPCLGGEIEIGVGILDNDSSPLQAVVPCLLEIIDSKGSVSEFSGYYGAKDGQLTIQYDIAKNDPVGLWKVVVKELASGIEVSHCFDVVKMEEETN